MHKLFRGHLEKINKQILPGLGKLKWSSKGVLESFVRDSKRAIAELQTILYMFKANNEKIEQKCNEVS